MSARYCTRSTRRLGMGGSAAGPHTKLALAKVPHVLVHVSGLGDALWLWPSEALLHIAEGSKAEWRFSLNLVDPALDDVISSSGLIRQAGFSRGNQWLGRVRLAAELAWLDTTFAPRTPMRKVIAAAKMHGQPFEDQEEDDADMSISSDSYEEDDAKEEGATSAGRMEEPAKEVKEEASLPAGAGMLAAAAGDRGQQVRVKQEQDVAGSAQQQAPGNHGSGSAAAAGQCTKIQVIRVIRLQQGMSECELALQSQQQPPAQQEHGPTGSGVYPTVMDRCGGRGVKQEELGAEQLQLTPSSYCNMGLEAARRDGAHKAEDMCAPAAGGGPDFGFLVVALKQATPDQHAPGGQQQLEEQQLEQLEKGQLPAHQERQRQREMKRKHEHCQAAHEEQDTPAGEGAIMQGVAAAAQNHQGSVAADAVEAVERRKKRTKRQRAHHREKIDHQDVPCAEGGGTMHQPHGRAPAQQWPMVGRQEGGGHALHGPRVEATSPNDDGEVELYRFSWPASQGMQQERHEGAEGMDTGAALCHSEQQGGSLELDQPDRTPAPVDVGQQEPQGDAAAEAAAAAAAGLGSMASGQTAGPHVHLRLPLPRFRALRFELDGDQLKPASESRIMSAVPDLLHHIGAAAAIDGFWQRWYSHYAASAAGRRDVVRHYNQLRSYARSSNLEGVMSTLREKFQLQV